MRVQSVVALLLLALAASSATTRDATCNFGSVPFPPEPNPRMSDCCWYRNSTCCVGGAMRLLPMVREALDNFAAHKIDGQCYVAVANFLCVFCNPNFGTYLEWGDLLPEKPANSADLCKMLFEAKVQNENNEVMYAIDITDAPDVPCFSGAASRDVFCSGCLQGSQCNPSLPPSRQPRPSHRPPPASALTVGIVVVAVLVLAGAFLACRYFIRAFRESSGSARRGRDFYPSSGDADNEALNS